MMNKFLKEIFEQPAALKNTLNYYLQGEGLTQLEKVSGIWKQGRFSHVLFTGMGSSFFAPQSASCLLSSYGIPSHTVNTGELLHYHHSTIRKDSLLTFVSQSGESYEVVKMLEKISGRATCIGISNEKESTLARKSEVILLTHAGAEEMTSTKTYVSTLLVLTIFSKVLAGKWETDSIPALKAAIEAVETLINDQKEWLAPAVEFLGRPQFVQVIGRGPSFSSVLQGALMFMEASRNPAAGMYGGEFRHGPMEMAKKGFRAVVFAPLGDTYNQGIRLAEDITKFGGRVLLITNDRIKLSNPDIHPVHIPCHDEYLFPIPAIVPLQFIVNQWAVDTGSEPGNFTMGAKITTTE
jgi:glucosamine--fructose-6-phosphate aminotransferase (isomerizing)